jgi:hypothetical protein
MSLNARLASTNHAGSPLKRELTYIPGHLADSRRCTTTQRVLKWPFRFRTSKAHAISSRQNTIGAPVGSSSQLQDRRERTSSNRGERAWVVPGQMWRRTDHTELSSCLAFHFGTLHFGWRTTYCQCTSLTRPASIDSIPSGKQLAALPCPVNTAISSRATDGTQRKPSQRLRVGVADWEARLGVWCTQVGVTAKIHRGLSFCAENPKSSCSTEQRMVQT